MPKRHPLGVRFEPNEAAAIERAAAAEDRTQSALVRRVVVEWLLAQGYLTKPLQPRKAARAAKEEE